MSKIKRVQKTAFIPEDVYKEWEKKNPFCTWSGWVNSMVLASINGSKDFLAEQRNKIEAMEEQLYSAEEVSKGIQSSVKKADKLKKESVVVQEDALNHIRKWSSLHHRASIEGDRELGDKAELLMKGIINNFGLSRAQVVDIAKKDVVSGD